MPTNIIYTIKQKENSRYYVPANGKQLVDVVSDMAWTRTPSSVREQYNNRVPYMILKEYQQTTGQLIASLIYYARVAQRVFLPNSDNAASGVINADNDPLEVYKLKYFGDETGFSYRLPYFNPIHTKRNNTFGADENPFSSLLELSNNITSFAKAMGSNQNLGKYSKISTFSSWTPAIMGLVNQILPGKIKFEYPSTWDETTPEVYSTSFDLINTETVDQVIQNRRFCHLITYQNSPSRRNFAIMDPPVIYSLTIPGVVTLPVCYVNDLSITNLGNTRAMYIDGIEAIIPEAYRISLSFQSLLLPTRNLLQAVESGRDVVSIANLDELQNIIGFDPREIPGNIERAFQNSNQSNAPIPEVNFIPRNIDTQNAFSNINLRSYDPANRPMSEDFREFAN